MRRLARNGAIVGGVTPARSRKIYQRNRVDLNVITLEQEIMIEAEGRLGATVAFDGQVVTIRRKGFRGSLVGRGEQQVHVGQLGAVEWKAPGPITREGFIRFVVGGTVARRARWGQRNTDARTDEWAVVFWRSHQPEFEELRAAVQAAIAAQHQAGVPGGVPAAADVVDQLRRLGELRDNGVLTETEFQAQKRKLLNQ